MRLFSKILIIILILLPLRIFSSPVRGVSGDLWADVVLGQPDFTTMAPNEVTNARVFNQGGVIVDRASTPQRLYVFDGNNSRILGFSDISVFSPNQSPSAPGYGADIVFGQPDFIHSGGNGDSNFGDYPALTQPNASTLCGMPADAGSPREGGAYITMGIDTQGNLYVPDVFNNRVVRYAKPPSGAMGPAATNVWGQPDMTSGYRDNSPPSAINLRLENTTSGAGAAVDSLGNLWVADAGNNRVLRFPNPNAPNPGIPLTTADVVLGQDDFVSKAGAASNTILARMNTPVTVCVDNSGNVFVGDFVIRDCGSNRGRVLVYRPDGIDGNGNPSYTNGMAAKGAITQYFSWPSGMGLDPSGGVWVADTCIHQVVLLDVSFPSGVMQYTARKVLLQKQPVAIATPFSATSGDGLNFSYSTGTNAPSFISYRPFGGLGVDTLGNVFVGFGNGVNDVWRFPAPIPTLPPVLTPGVTGIGRSADVAVLKPRQFGMMNDVGYKGIDSGIGVAVAQGQLILSEGWRLDYWNMPGLGQSLSGLVNFKQPDGYAGIDSADVLFSYMPYSYNGESASIARIREDHDSPQRHLWVVRHTYSTDIEIYNLPLTPFATPVATMQRSIPLLGSPSTMVTWTYPMFGIAPDIDGAGRNYLWIADQANNRVYRVRNPLTNPEVDIILGQPDAVSNHINYIDAAHYGSLSDASAASLYGASQVELDHSGNLYVSDFVLEYRGNQRLLRFDASTIQNNSATTPVFHTAASAVFARNGNFTTGYNQCSVPPAPELNSCMPFEPAFTSDDSVMVLGTMYGGSQFLKAFTDPNASPLINDEPAAYLKDFGSAYFGGTFDDDDNFYAVDLNRARLLVYWKPFSTPVPTPTPDCCTFANSYTMPALSGSTGGLAVDISRNRVYVLDSTVGLLRAFDYSGNTVTSFGAGGSVYIAGVFGIAAGKCDFDGVYAAVRGTNSVVKVDAGGNITPFNVSPVSAGLRSISVDAFGNVYVTSDGGAVEILDSTGVLRQTITGSMSAPTGLVKTGLNLYVNDTVNMRVVKFTETGLNSYVYSPGPVTVAVMPWWPYGMTEDLAGNIYVISAQTGSYEVYDNLFNSKLVSCAPSSATNGSGIGTDQFGNIYLAEYIFGKNTINKMAPCPQFTQPVIPACNVTPSNTPTQQPSYTVTPGVTQTNTQTITNTQTPDASGTATPSCTETVSGTITMTVEESFTHTATPSMTFTPVPPGPTATCALSARPFLLYPNPAYDKKAYIGYSICGTPGIRAKIYTMGHRKIREITFAPAASAGVIEIELTDSRGRALSSGIYYIVVETLGKKAEGGEVRAVLQAVVLKI